LHKKNSITIIDGADHSKHALNYILESRNKARAEFAPTIISTRPSLALLSDLRFHYLTHLRDTLRELGVWREFTKMAKTRNLPTGRFIFNRVSLMAD